MGFASSHVGDVMGFLTPSLLLGIPPINPNLLTINIKNFMASILS